MKPSAPDLNDAAKTGVGLADLMAIAQTQGPAPLRGEAERAKLAEDGLRLLDDLGADLLAAQHDDDAKEQAREGIGRLMEPGPRALLGWAQRLREMDVTRRLTALRWPTGVGEERRDLIRLIKTQARELEGEEKDAAAREAGEGGSLASLVRDLGLPDGVKLQAPGGWRVTSSGVEMVKVSPDGEARFVEVAPAPIVVCGMARDVVRGGSSPPDEWLELAWRWPGEGWRRAEVPREKALQAREIAALASCGAPLSSVTAASVVQYIAAFEAANRRALPVKDVSKAMGWQPGGGFLLGDTFLGDDGGVALVGDSDTLQDVGAWAVNGSWEVWRDAVHEIMDERPMAALGIYAALCSPLLHFLQLEEGFTVSWDGHTSRGKTTTIAGAMSVYGDPKRLVMSWDTTTVGVERTLALRCHLPTALDDTKTAPRRAASKMIPEVIYMVTRGETRTRGQRAEGTRAKQRWLGVLLSTGEQPITSFSEDGGAVARVLSIRGAPFGEDSAANAAASERLKRVVRRNHGHLGRRLIAYLVENMDRREEIEARYWELHENYTEHATGVGRRLAAHVALLALTAEIAHDELGLPRFALDPIDAAWAALQEGEGEADKPREAMEAFGTWAASNQDKFWGRHRTEQDKPTGRPIEPHGGFYGEWAAGEKTWEYIGVRREVLVKVLTEWGYDLGVLHSWKQRGWINVTTDPRSGKASTSTLVTINGVRNRRVIAILRAALESGEPDHGEPEYVETEPLPY